MGLASFLDQTRQMDRSLLSCPWGPWPGFQNVPAAGRKRTGETLFDPFSVSLSDGAHSLTSNL